MDGNDQHSASRRADVLEDEAPHLLDPESPATIRRRALEEIIATTHDLGLEDEGGVARIRQLARFLHAAEPVELAAPFRITGDPEHDNRVRARGALMAVAAWPHGDGRDLTDPYELTEVVGDLVCDLLHFAQQGGGDPMLCLDRGERHWQDECAEALAEESRRARGDAS
jgi:hypothetical protein